MVYLRCVTLPFQPLETKVSRYTSSYYHGFHSSLSIVLVVHHNDLAISTQARGSFSFAAPQLRHLDKFLHHTHYVLIQCTGWLGTCSPYQNLAAKPRDRHMATYDA
jgi:hypothetical protein